MLILQHDTDSCPILFFPLIMGKTLGLLQPIEYSRSNSVWLLNLDYKKSMQFCLTHRTPKLYELICHCIRKHKLAHVTRPQGKVICRCPSQQTDLWMQTRDMTLSKPWWLRVVPTCCGWRKWVISICLQKRWRSVSGSANSSAKLLLDNVSHKNLWVTCIAYFCAHSLASVL